MVMVLKEEGIPILRWAVTLLFKLGRTLSAAYSGMQLADFLNGFHSCTSNVENLLMFHQDASDWRLCSKHEVSW